MKDKVILSDLKKNLLCFGDGFTKSNTAAKYIKLSVDVRGGAQKAEMLPTVCLFPNYVVLRSAVLKKRLDFLTSTINVDLIHLAKVIRVMTAPPLSADVTITQVAATSRFGGAIGQVEIGAPGCSDIVRTMDDSVWNNSLANTGHNVDIASWVDGRTPLATIQIDAVTTAALRRTSKLLDETTDDKLSLQFDGTRLWLCSEASWGSGRAALSSMSRDREPWRIAFNGRLISHLGKLPAASSIDIYRCPLTQPGDTQQYGMVLKIGLESLYAKYEFSLYPAAIAGWRNSH
jgi:hypothetical protein